MELDEETKEMLIAVYTEGPDLSERELAEALIRILREQYPDSTPDERLKMLGEFVAKVRAEYGEFKRRRH